MHDHRIAANLLQVLDLGSSIAEMDNLLQTARVETSAFSDLLQDKVDLIPGTKGSGKSALFRIFVDFLPEHLLRSRKVVIAHGVQKHGDEVFHAYKEQFDQLGEDDFVSFWCIYLTSLAHEQFIKGDLYREFIRGAEQEVDAFRRACAKAGIPEIKAKKSLRDILAWALNVLKVCRPRLKYKLPHEGGEVSLDLFGQVSPEATQQRKDGSESVPHSIGEVKDRLEDVLKRTNLSMWLMVDRLDEIFPRRTEVETKALRGLLNCLRLFSTDLIRVKIFLRDDMLEQVVGTPDGFTALTHVTARRADTLRWSEEQILTMLVKRIFADEGMATYLKVDRQRLDASQEYRSECFYKVFPATVHSGEKQSSTLHWIYSRTTDGRGVVTPRDVLDLVTKAKQQQQDEFNAALAGQSPWLIGPKPIQHGLEDLSKRKRDTYLRAEFPHLWSCIEKFEGGKTEYDPGSLQKLLGRGWERAVADLVSIGVLGKKGRSREITYWFPPLYRKGLCLTQGRA
jgi:hypothetical protein